MTELKPENSWVPDACTLPTTEQPVRLAEFDRVFATVVRSVDRVDELRASFDLVPAAEVAAQVADLAVRETACCSFFSFTLLMAGGRVTLDVAVRAEYRDVLDALVERAAGGTR